MRRRTLAVGLAALAMVAALLCLPERGRTGRRPAPAATRRGPQASPDSSSLPGGPAAPAAGRSRSDPLARLSPPIAALPTGDGKAYAIHDRRVSARFSAKGVALSVRKPASRDPASPSPAGVETIGWGVSGAREVEPRPEGLLETRINYFVGARANWRSDLPSYSRVVYPELRPGIDLVLESRPHGLKYSLLVAPGADAENLEFEYEGASEIRVAEDGASLQALTGSGTFRESELRCWQETPDGRRPVPARYAGSGGARYVIRLGAYDPTLPVVVDPVISWGSFIGGALDSASIDSARAIAVNGLGEAYVAGQTTATDFPVLNAFRTTLRAGTDLFVSKLNAAGTALLWSTYLGGDGEDSVSGIAVSGNRIYLTGQTLSTDFPTSPGALDTTLGGVTDAFVAVLDETSFPLTLPVSTYLGGTAQDVGMSIAVDGTGIYACGWSFSTNFPVVPVGNLYPRTAGFAGWAAKLDLTGTTLLWSGYLGAGQANALAVDGAQNVYIAGHTSTATLPVSGGSFDSTWNGADDAYVAKINASGATFAWSTFLGGGGYESARGIGIDAGLNVYVAGYTTSAEFPVTAGAFSTTFNGGSDAFVTKLNAAGTALAYSTFLGGAGLDEGWKLVVDGAGQATTVGYTRSETPDPFPTSIGAFDRSHNGSMDGFVARLDAAGASLVYSTYLGGGADEQILSIAQDGSGAVYVAGETASATNQSPVFPVTPGVYDVTLGGLQDGFVAKLNATGTALTFCTYLGGDTRPSQDSAFAVALDSTGAVTVAGYTTSISDFVDPATFPATGGAYQPGLRGGEDAFVARINAGGATLAWCTYLGGTQDDRAAEVAVDSFGDAYVVGETKSSDFPAYQGVQGSLLGDSDAFVTKFDSAGQLVWSTYLGGSLTDAGGAVAVDTDRMVYVTGSSQSTDFPTTTGPFGTVPAGGAFLTKIHRSGATAVWSAFIGDGTPRGIGLDGVGNVYVAGSTTSLVFPTTPGAFQTSFPTGSGETGFVCKVASSGDSLVWSTFLGGTNFDLIFGLAVEPGGACVVVGASASADFPTTPGAFDTTLTDLDAFVTKVQPGGGALSWSTFLGGTGWDFPLDVALDSIGNVYLTGVTMAPDFPATISGMDTTLDGPSDAFVAKLHASGATLLWASYLGGSLDDQGVDIAVDPTGAVYVTGETESVGFPTTGGVFDPVFAGTSEGFVLRISNPAAGAIAGAALGQFRSDGATALLQGETTDELRVVLSALIADPEGDQVRLQLEVQPVGTAFTGAPNAEGAFVQSGTIARVEVRSLAAGTSYHWQARAIDPGGQFSPWTSFGTNLDGAPPGVPADADFVVSATAGATPAAPVAGSSSSGGCGSSGLDLLLPVLLLGALRRRRGAMGAA